MFEEFENLKTKISIIVPTYNESHRILSSLEEIAGTFSKFTFPWEVIVMDDGSVDGTATIAQEIRRKYPGNFLIKRNSINTGKGRVLKKSLRYVTGDYVVFLDADMELHPVQIETLFDIMKLVDADIVIGSKLHPNSVVSYPLNRKIVSFVYYILVRILFNLPCHDTQTGLKLFKTKVLKRVFPRILVKKFAFDLEVLVNAHHLGYKIIEAPIVLKSLRRQGRIGLKAIVITLWDTLAVFYRMHILRYYDRIDYYRRKNMAKKFRRVR